MRDARAPMHYRLGLDVGTGSLGWAVIELDDKGTPFRVERLGSRIFGTGRKPKDNTSLAADRRQARSARRRRDRYIQRRNRLLHELTAAGLFPADRAERAALKHLNPFQLRAEGLDRELSPHELGRALVHLQQRRGFKSNRKAEKGDSEASEMKRAIRDTDAKVADFGPNATVGAYLWAEIKAGRGARARHRTEGAKNVYDFYVGREMVEAEFDALWEAQSRFHASLLTVEAQSRVRAAIFDQRPLRSVDPGKCLYEKDESGEPLRRASDALVSSQLFRLYQEVNNLRVKDRDELDQRERPLTRAERDRAITLLLHHPKGRATFAELKRELFGRAAKVTFSHEGGERAGFKGEPVSAKFADDRAFGPAWWALSLDEQDEVAQRVEDLEGPDSERAFTEWLTHTHALDVVRAEFVATRISLPDGHRRLSTAAIKKLLPHLIDGWDDEPDQALTYDKAVQRAGYRHHSIFHTGELFERLPYYGAILTHYTQDVARLDVDEVRQRTNPDEVEFGKIANPTVHIGLNQVRTIVNALVDQYGPPAQIHVELARELGQSEKARAEASKRRNDNEKRNDDLRHKLRTEFGVADNFHNRERLRLFEDLGALDHRCVITGRVIERSKLFSNEYQVDHILPFQRTLDDSYSNKMLVHFTANQQKGDRSPWEAFGEDDQRWNEILERAEAAFGRSGPKFRRFGADAMDRYEGPEADGDFIARQLTDTAYLARATKQYLGSLIDPDNVITMPGRLTGMLRAKWGLNSLLAPGAVKNRADHRHHAIDAAVVALTDRSTLKRVTDANRRAEQLFQSNEEGEKKLLKDFEPPWEGFHREMDRKVDAIVVSHKPDHSAGGQLHEDTAFGVLEGPDKQGRYLTVKTAKDSKTGKRLGREEPKWRPVVPVFHRGEGPDSALPYKAYIGGSNYCIEIVRLSSGKWAGEVISTFQANQREYREFMEDKRRFVRESFSGLPLVMRLVVDDTIAVEHNERRRIMRLVKVATSTQMHFAEVHEGNVADRNSKKDDPYTMLSSNPAPLANKWQARRVFVDPLGNVHDPGFRP